MTTASEALMGAAPAAATPAPAPTAASTPAPEFVADNHGGLTQEQLKILANDAVARGTLTREKADAELAADGVPAEKTEEGLSAEAEAIDRDFPAAAAHEYQFPLYGAPGEALTPEQQKADATFRGWLADARFPANLGSSLAKTIDQEATTLAKMSAIERMLYGKSQSLMLERTWGKETQEKISLARQLVRELEARRPGLLEFVERTGIGNSARVIAALAAQAQRLAARRK